MSAAEAHTAELEAISGPSALGGGARRFFDLLWLTSVTQFRLGYHGTVLGFAWSLMRPLLLFGVLLAVFTQVFELGDEIRNYPPLLLFNIMLFTFFQTATDQAVGSVVSNENVVRKMQFPRLVIPLSVVLTNCLQLALNLLVVFVFMIAYGVEPLWTWLLTPVIVGATILFTTCVAMLLSALYVRIRDVWIMWTVSATILFYATPVLYPIDYIPDGTLQDIIAMNPLSPIFEQANEWLMNPDAPGAQELAAGKPHLLLVPILLYIAICVAGVFVFRREAPHVAEAL
jgi:ABC-2 type transport system permease protein